MLYVHAPAPERVFIRWSHCPTCGHKAPALVVVYRWYGISDICLWCGDRWIDHELVDRPRGYQWRRDSVSRAVRFAGDHGLEVYEWSRGVT